MIRARALASGLTSINRAQAIVRADFADKSKRSLGFLFLVWLNSVHIYIPK